MTRAVSLLELATEIARRHERAPTGHINVIRVLVDDLEKNHVKDYMGEADHGFFSALAANTIPMLLFLFFWFSLYSFGYLC